MHTESRYTPASGHSTCWTLFLLLAVHVALSGAPAAAAPREVVRAVQAVEEIPEDELLDVAIRVFDPGVVETGDPIADKLDLEEKGIYAEVRRAESRYFAVRLMDTLQSTGFWGAVRVVPDGADPAHLLVDGEILESNGGRLMLSIRAHDATGRRWLEKKYKEKADGIAYVDDPDVLALGPFENLYNRIANDLLAARRKMRAGDLEAIRRVARMEFAADLIPAAFGEFLDTDRKGHTVVEGLPSEEDPMVRRVAELRERELLFIDTLTEHYVNFYARVNESYTSWRKYSYEEELAMRKLKKKARTRQILGALGVLAGVVSDDRNVSNVGIYGGLMAIQSGSNKAREAKMHRESLRELAKSFENEAAPLVVEVDGEIHRLAGSVESQYEAWRKLLREIFIVETGVPLDPNTGEPLEAPSVEAAEAVERTTQPDIGG